MDGGGYPGGLAGELIPEYVRALAVADVYDALTSKRVYAPAMGQGAVTKLRQSGIDVIRGASGPVHEAAKAWLAGNLADRDELCKSHDCQH